MLCIKIIRGESSTYEFSSEMYNVKWTAGLMGSICLSSLYQYVEWVQY